MRQALQKPQFPPAPQWGSGQQNWTNAWTVLTQARQYMSVLVLYLQTYLGRVQQYVVPFARTAVAVLSSQSPYSVQPTDEFLAVSPGTAANSIVNLPLAVGSGRVIKVKSWGTNTGFGVQIVPAGTDKIDDMTSFTITTYKAFVEIADMAAGQWLISG